jgi:hypothetical protein
VGGGALLVATAGALVVAFAGGDPAFLSLWLPISVIADNGSASGADRLRPAYVFSTVSVAVVAGLALGLRGRTPAATAAAPATSDAVSVASADAVGAAVEVTA